MAYKSPEDFSSLFELLDYFKDEQTCLGFLAEQRWPGGIECPHCHHNKIYTLKGNTKRYKCAACRKQFTAKANTIFEDSKLPLRKWFAAIYLLLAHRKGISSYQLARDLKVTQKTAYFIGQKIRVALNNGSFNVTKESVIEVDETFVGGKTKNRHWNKKVKDAGGRSFKDKVPVFGMLVRGGNVKCIVVNDTKTRTIQPLIHKYIPQWATIYSDEWSAYTGLSMNYNHSTIDHSKKQYKVGNVHTNNIEGFWSLFKKGMVTYCRVSKKHLQKYVDEFCFKYNIRKDNAFKVRFREVLKGENIKNKQIV